ncbi:hypothetical protein L1987_70071 [Smallanthus sonchifolius]|uniref:Uncharacterized protein n=1 Tax=Smallanthus sonchifolius TaxID=185202 RepID=A0ACB9AMU5_9ASTR|nr:hypothetical protein L1987_70071 [Smallanthus sonchifolius]
MSTNEDADDYQSNGHRFHNVKQKLKDRSRKVVETKEKTKEILSKQAFKIAKHAEEHESFITKKVARLGLHGLMLETNHCCGHGNSLKRHKKQTTYGGLLGDRNRLFMYILLQAVFKVVTMALTVPIYLSYEMHLAFQILKVSATVWNGGSFLLEVMLVLKEKKKQKPVQDSNHTEVNNVSEMQS